MDDLGLSGEGGPQESETLIIRLVIDAINDGPMIHLPNSFVGNEDGPLLLSGISVSDVDSGDHGGEVLTFGYLKDAERIIARRPSCQNAESHVSLRTTATPKQDTPLRVCIKNEMVSN